MVENLKVKRLKNFLEKENIDASFFEFSEPTLTVEDAARQLEVESEKIVKSLVFKDEKNNPLLAIVSGNTEVDPEKLSEICGSDVNIAKAREVEEFSGYKVGEVPPVSHGLKTFVDSKVIEFDKIIAGGGSTHTLVELSPEDIIEVTSAEIEDISEDSK